MAAPTAVNSQGWFFIVLTDKAIMNELSSVLPYAKMLTTAQAAILVCGDMDKTFGGGKDCYWVMDTSAATENILLAAHSLGLGAVWTAVYPNSNRVEPVNDILGLPSNIIPLNVIPIGYPDGKTEVKQKYFPNKVHYNKW